MGGFLLTISNTPALSTLLRYIINNYRASLIAQLVKIPPAMKRLQLSSWVGNICWRRDRLSTPVFLGFPCGSAVEESACNARDLGLIPGLERSLGEGKGYPTPVFWPGEFCGVYNPWGLKESLTRLSDFHFSSYTSFYLRKHL